MNPYDPEYVMIRKSQWDEIVSRDLEQRQKIEAFATKTGIVEMALIAYDKVVSNLETIPDAKVKCAAEYCKNTRNQMKSIIEGYFDI